MRTLLRIAFGIALVAATAAHVGGQEPNFGRALVLTDNELLIVTLLFHDQHAALAEIALRTAQRGMCEMFWIGQCQIARRT